MMMVNNQLFPFSPSSEFDFKGEEFPLQHLFLFVSFRNDGSIFDGLVEEDDKDKAKR